VDDIKIKQVSYERLESDPHGYNNTRIGMIANVDKNENPVTILNELKMLVDGRHNAYREVRESNHKISILENSLFHMKHSLHQIKLDDNQVERIETLNKDISDNEIELQKLKKRIHNIT